MTSTRLGRVFAVAGGLLVVALAASGCTTGQNENDEVAAPKVGDCWQVTYAHAVQSEDWQGSGAVPCAATHESYTYAVTRLTETFSGSWLNSDGNARPDVDTAAFDACLARQKALLPAITPNEALFYPTYYIPSVVQWNDGARWVRCDMTEIKVGSAIAKPNLTPLPARFADLVSEVEATPKRFALCEDDVLNNGPDGAGTTYADCTKPADWTFVVRLTLPGGAGAAYPGTATLKPLAMQKCRKAVTSNGQDLFAKIPSETAWVQHGDRSVDCWLNNN